MLKKIFPASDEALHNAVAFAEETLEEVGCSMKTIMQVSVCVEEMFVNVAHYAYPEGTGDVVMELAVEDSVVSITLTDNGVPFDPLAKADPDVTLSVEERKIGGLGIYMVKKSMDEVSYFRRDGKNIFNMKKYI